MNFRKHFLGGIIFYILLILFNSKYNFLNLQGFNLIIGGIIFVLASLIPDMDVKSKIKKFSFSIGYIVIIVLLIFKFILPALLMALIMVVINKVPHRTAFHSLTFGFIGALIISYAWSYIFGILAFGGFLIHLILDIIGSTFRIK